MYKIKLVHKHTIPNKPSTGSFYTVYKVNNYGTEEAIEDFKCLSKAIEFKNNLMKSKNKNDFFEKWCESVGFEVWEAKEAGLMAVVCNCNIESCPGWTIERVYHDHSNSCNNVHNNTFCNE